MEGSSAREEGAMIISMHGNVEQPRMLGRSELSSIAMVDVPVDDEDTRGLTTAEDRQSRNCDGVEVTETCSLIRFCVMARWMN